VRNVINIRWEVTDIRNFKVTCDDFQCSDHIQDEHDGILEYEEEIKNAIIKPRNNIVYGDKFISSNHIYYHKINEFFEIKVVAEFDDNSDGYILTAYLIKGRPKGEKILWPA